LQSHHWKDSLHLPVYFKHSIRFFLQPHTHTQSHTLRTHARTHAHIYKITDVPTLSIALKQDRGNQKLEVHVRVLCTISWKIKHLLMCAFPNTCIHAHSQTRAHKHCDIHTMMWGLSKRYFFDGVCEPGPDFSIDAKIEQATASDIQYEFRFSDSLGKWPAKLEHNMQTIFFVTSALIMFSKASLKRCWRHLSMSGLRGRLYISVTNSESHFFSNMRFRECMCSLCVCEFLRGCSCVLVFKHNCTNLLQTYLACAQTLNTFEMFVYDDRLY